MKAEIWVFMAAIALSCAAFALTMHNVPLGAVELNPIGAFWIGLGLPFIGFLAGWAIVIVTYKLTVFSDRFNFPKEHRYLALGLLLGIAFADFLFDFLNYAYIINH